jgi:hypothetical protein
MPEGTSDPRRKAAVHMKPKRSIPVWRAAGWPQARVRDMEMTILYVVAGQWRCHECLLVPRVLNKPGLQTLPHGRVSDWRCGFAQRGSD